MSEPDTRPEAPPGRAGLSGGILTLLFLGVVAVGVVIAVVGDDPAAAEVGQPAPAIAVNTFDGELIDLVDHFRFDRGPVLLNLWASWCRPCIEEFPVLSEYALSHPEVTVIGVAVQDQLDDARRFADELAPDFHVAFDSDGSVRESYPSFALPATYVIGSDGVIVDVVLAQLTTERLEAIEIR